SDAHYLGKIDVTYAPARHKVQSVDWAFIPVTDKLSDDPDMRAVINSFESQFSAHLEEPVGEATVSLDAVQADNRSQETNLGDFIADAFRQHTGADVALVNGGSIRTNIVHAPGEIKRKDVLSILPFENAVVKLEVKGSVLRKALENGVSEIGAGR